MIRSRHLVLSTLLLAASAMTAHAEHPSFAPNGTADIDARRANEMRRIEEGRRSGELSWREYRVLKAEQHRIAEHERHAKADGYISPAERRELNREIDQASAHIYSLKHNGETANGWRRWSRWW